MKTLAKCMVSLSLLGILSTAAFAQSSMGTDKMAPMSTMSDKMSDTKMSTKMEDKKMMPMHHKKSMKMMAMKKDSMKKDMMSKDTMKPSM